jgi:hypothetical protein
VFVEDDGVGASPAEALIINLGDRLRPFHDDSTEPVEAAPVPPEPLAADDGAAAKTAARLARLDGTRWYVCRDVTGSADHLVIGPGGVFAVRSLRLVGHAAVTGDGVLHNGEPIDCVVRVARRASQLSSRLSRAAGLPVRIRPVLAVDSDGFSPGTDPPDVAVVSAARVHKWLLRQPEWMPPHETFRIAATARRASTWR